MLQQSVAAMVSLAGAANGSEIDDLRRDVRHRGWQANGHRITVPILSLVEVPEPDRVSTLLRLAHARLSELDPYDDGQLPWTDAGER